MGKIFYHTSEAKTQKANVTGELTLMYVHIWGQDCHQTSPRKQALISERADEARRPTISNRARMWDRQAGAAEYEGVYEFSIAAVTTHHKCGDTASLTAPEVRQPVSPVCVTVQQGRPPSCQLSGTIHCRLIQVAEFSSTGL